MKRIILRLLGLVALIFISYGAARLLVAAWLPGAAERLLLGLPLLAVAVPLAYWVLTRQFRPTHEIPYFLLRPDFLLPLSAFAASLIVFVFIAPRFALWQWGEVGTGRVNALIIDERFDPDLGRTINYRVDYLFAEEEGGSSIHSSIISQELFDSLQLEDMIRVHFLPWWPKMITAGDPVLFGWQATVLTWGTLIVLLWLIGAAVAGKFRSAPAEPSPYPPPVTAAELLQRYDLDTLLTGGDDAELWAAIVRKNFPLPEDEALHVAGLRFGTGAYAPDARLKMQPAAATCFTRVDAHYLRRAACVPDAQTDADFDPALLPTVPLLLLYLNKAGVEKRPLYSIIVPRPSSNKEQLPVYCAVWQRNGSAYGETAYWERLPDGRWQHSGEKLNWWMDGA